MIYDDVGCWNVSHRFFERMREEGRIIQVMIELRLCLDIVEQFLCLRIELCLIAVDVQSSELDGESGSSRVLHLLICCLRLYCHR